MKFRALILSPLFVFISQVGLAEEPSLSPIVKTEKISVFHPGGASGDYIFELREDNSLWIRADHNEARRYGYYGPEKIDYNKPVKAGYIETFFEFNNEIYLVGNYNLSNELGKDSYLVFKAIPHSGKGLYGGQKKFLKHISLALASSLAVIKASIIGFEAGHTIIGPMILLLLGHISMFYGEVVNETFAKCGATICNSVQGTLNPLTVRNPMGQFTDYAKVQRIDDKLPWSVENMNLIAKDETRPLSAVLESMKCQWVLTGN